MSLGAEVHARGWRAGSVLPRPMHEAVASHLCRTGETAQNVASDDWIIVVSQACDLVANNDGQEPYVEILWCRTVPRLRSQFQDLRSTRTLDFRPDKTTRPHVVLTAHAGKDRYLLPRTKLLTFSPDTDRRLSRQAVERLQTWFALRYSRPAWPNCFVDRIQSAKGALEDTLKPLSDDIAHVRIGIAQKDTELGNEDVYNVTVHFIVDQVVWDESPDKREEVQQAYAKFISALSKCSGVAVNQDLGGVKSGDEFSWQATQLTDEWNFAYLTPLE